MKDLNDEVYNEINYVKSFLQYYEEEFDLSKGTGRVKFFVRNKDDIETAMGARVAKKDVVDESVLKDEFDVGILPVIAPIEGALKSDNYARLYREVGHSGTEYDEADILLNQSKQVKIEIQDKGSYNGYNFNGNTVVRGDVLKEIVDDIETSMDLSSVSDRDYYVLKTFGDIDNSKYSYKYKNQTEIDELIFEEIIYVMKDQLLAMGWNENDIAIEEINQCLHKYEITTVERLRHFFAQVNKESYYGKYTREGENLLESPDNFIQEEYEKYYN